MINLIPSHAKKRVRTEYLIRVASMWMLLCALSLYTGIVLLVPTYVLYSRQIEAGTTPDTTRAERAESIASMRATLGEANAFAQQLSRSLDSVQASEVLAHIERAQVEGIDFQGMYVVREKEAMRIEVKVNAATRERLRAFQDALRRDAFFATAEVPVSQLAKDTDLSVTIALTLRTES